MLAKDLACFLSKYLVQNGSNREGKNEQSIVDWVNEYSQSIAYLKTIPISYGLRQDFPENHDY